MTVYEKIERSASGKVILCGEHSVVYGRPAIAVPISDLRTRCWVEPAVPGSGLRLVATDLQKAVSLRAAPESHTLGKTARLVLEKLQAPEPDAVLTVASEVPIASGMGSGAAVAVAIARALSAYLGSELPSDVVNDIAFEVEKIHHGNPSGIDNTVISWEQPVYFVRGHEPEMIDIRSSFHLIIANSGIAGSTREAIDEVRRRWTAMPGYYEMVFNCIGTIANAARAAVEQGAIQGLGTLLNQNHELLVTMGISISQLDQMVAAARKAGALGAKLTGAGQGGNMIALVEEPRIAAVTQALRDAGAVKLWVTTVRGGDV
ncbi:MAG: mevalonate kinase [Anaerolineae bacterium]|nr:mevalonate kinase [Anaerolineae bacterium]